MLDFFLSSAWAQGAQPQGGGGPFFFMMLAFFFIFYLLLIRPQKKQANEHKKMLKILTKGDEVVTNGGMLGRINKIGENFIAIEIAKDLEIKIQKHAISTVLPKGTIKGL